MPAISSSAVVTIDLDLISRLEAKAAATCTRIKELCEGSDYIAHELQDKYFAAIADIEQVRIQSLSSDDGAFTVIDGELQIHDEPIAKLLRTVIEDIESRAAIKGTELLHDEIPEIMERVFVDYVQIGRASCRERVLMPV